MSRSAAARLLLSSPTLRQPARSAGRKAPRKPAPIATPSASTAATNASRERFANTAGFVPQRQLVVRRIMLQIVRRQRTDRMHALDKLRNTAPALFVSRG